MPDLLPKRFADWFAARGWTPHRHQLEMLDAAREGRSVLLTAPTGGGKTLAGFLPSLVEKGSSYPGLPPYDTAATRLDRADREALAALVGAHDWLWVAGNHDPAPPALGGRVVSEIAIGDLRFRRQAEAAVHPGEVSGHYHPKAYWRARGRSVRGRCFVADGRRLILPAFGAYAGGLDVRDPAIARLFPDGCDVHLIARGRITRLPRDEKPIRR